jgi:hypothetical protein
LVDRINRPHKVEGHALGTSDYQHFDRINWGTFFKCHPDPPDVLVIQIPKDPRLETDWEKRFLDRMAGKTPNYLMIVKRAGEVLRSQSSIYRARVKQFQKAGYEGVLKHVDSSSCGSPTWGGFFITIYYQKVLGIKDDSALKLIGDLDLLPRNFHNCLMPVGVPRKLWAPKGRQYQSAKTPQKPNHLGSLLQHPVVDSSGPALLDPDLLISLPSGMRKFDPMEWVKLKGLPKAWGPGPKSLRGIVESMGAHDWSALGDFVGSLEALRMTNAGTAPSTGETLADPEIPPLSPEGDAELPEWHWEPPDLGADSPFYH